MKITTTEFKKALDREPEHDDLERCNCDEAGELGHHACGWCEKCSTPRFHCGHLLFLNRNFDSGEPSYTMQGPGSSPLPGHFSTKPSDNRSAETIKKEQIEEALSRAMSKEIEERKDKPVSKSLDKLSKASSKFFLDRMKAADNDAKAGPDAETTQKAALEKFVATVEITGGVTEGRKGHYVPVIDIHWVDLGEAYIVACEALGKEPKIEKEVT